MVLYENCRRYEAYPINTGAGGNAADFLFMLLLGIVLLTIVGHFFGLAVLSISLLYMIMYVWSRHEPDTPISFYGFKFQGLYLPWIYVGISTLMGNSLTEPMVGIAVGHVYYFLVEIMPQTYNMSVIKTPRFCADLVNFATGTTTVPPPFRGGDGNARQQQGFGNMGAGHNWGRGRTLGAR